MVFVDFIPLHDSIYPPPPQKKQLFSHFVFFFAILSAASVEIDGSLGDSDSLKEPGSKKRYTIFYSPLLFVVQNNFMLMKERIKNQNV